ncbi:hypothetical protein ACFPRL_36285 [Pseudoclavibacter helvolus]
MRATARRQRGLSGSQLAPVSSAQGLDAQSQGWAPDGEQVRPSDSRH